MTTLLFIPGVGPLELLIVLGLALLLFGRRVPDLARGAARGIVEFRRGLAELPGPTGRAAREERPGS